MLTIAFNLLFNSVPLNHINFYFNFILTILFTCTYYRLLLRSVLPPCFCFGPLNHIYKKNILTTLLIAILLAFASLKLLSIRKSWSHEILITLLHPWIKQLK